MTDADEPSDDVDAPLGLDGEDEGAAAEDGWQEAIGQMAAAVLVVVALVALFIGAAVALRRLLP